MEKEFYLSKSFQPPFKGDMFVPRREPFSAGAVTERFWIERVQ